LAKSSYTESPVDLRNILLGIIINPLPRCPVLILAALKHSQARKIPPGPSGKDLKKVNSSSKWAPRHLLSG